MSLITSHKSADLIAAFFIVLFTYTASSKFMELQQFAAVLSASPLIKHFAPPLAYSLPLLELIIAGLLFFPKTKLRGLYSSLVLMIAFTVYLCYMILFTPHLPCSCGAALKQLTWKQHIIFNLALIILAMYAIITATNHKLFIAINRQSRTPV